VTLAMLHFVAFAGLMLHRFLASPQVHNKL
jgi:hypothetical protein